MPLLSSLPRVVSGRLDVRPALRRLFPGRRRNLSPKEASELSELSPRQREVLLLVLAHRTDEEIASRLGIAPGTVKSHIRLIRSALGVKTRDELCRWPGRQRH